MIDLPTADREQLAAFIVCIFLSSSHHLCRTTPYCPCSAMNVCWLSGPPPLRPSFPHVMISRTALSSYCGEPVPRLSLLKDQALLRTPFLVTLPNPVTHSGPLHLLVIVLSSASSLPPRVPVLRTPLRPPLPMTLKRVRWLPRHRLNELGTVKSTLSMSIQTRRFPVPPCCMHVYTMAWLPGSACVSRLYSWLPKCL